MADLSNRFTIGTRQEPAGYSMNPGWSTAGYSMNPTWSPEQPYMGPWRPLDRPRAGKKLNILKNLEGIQKNRMFRQFSRSHGANR